MGTGWSMGCATRSADPKVTVEALSRRAFHQHGTTVLAMQSHGQILCQMRHTLAGEAKGSTNLWLMQGRSSSGRGTMAWRPRSTLRAKGWIVAVVEGSPRRRAARSRSAALTLPGFRHDLYAMNVSLFAGSPFLAAHTGLGLERHGLAFVPAPDSFASVFPGGHLARGEPGSRGDGRPGSQRISAARRGAAWRAMHGREFRGGCAAYLFGLLGSRPCRPGVRRCRPCGACTWRAKGLSAGWPSLGTPATLVAARLPRPAFREPDILKTTMASLGNAPRLSARCGRRSPVSLSRIDGMPELRDGDRAGRRRHHDQGPSTGASQGTRRRAASRGAGRQRDPETGWQGIATGVQARKMARRLAADAGRDRQRPPPKRVFDSLLPQGAIAGRLPGAGSPASGPAPAP